MRFGLDAAENELGPRELGVITGALSAQMRYCNRLAALNKDEEAKGRNIVNALEIRVLLDKIKRIEKGETA